MSRKPYPGYNPNFSPVRKIDGYNRTVFVVEILSQGTIDGITRSMIIERIEHEIVKIVGDDAKVDCVDESRFDTLLLDGLRLR